MLKTSVGGIVRDASHRHDRATADQVVVIESDPLTPVRRVSLLDAVHRLASVVDIELDLSPRNERQKQFPRHEAGAYVTTYDPPDRRGWVNDAPTNGRADPARFQIPPANKVASVTKTCEGCRREYSARSPRQR
jgi:hypothetical protein